MLATGGDSTETDGSDTIIGTLRASLAIDYATPCMQLPTAGFAEKGQPMSVHKAAYAVRAVNNLLAYKTRNVLINQFMQTNAAVTGTTTNMVFVGWVPVYGHVGLLTTRALICRLRGKTSSGTATFTIRSTPTMPMGTSFSSYSYTYGSTSQSFATTSTSFEWSSELTLTPSATPAVSGGSMWGTWIVVEAAGSGGGVTATLSNVFVCEQELT